MQWVYLNISDSYILLPYYLIRYQITYDIISKIPQIHFGRIVLDVKYSSL